MMKSTQKITRIQLNVTRKDELYLYGIVSAEPDYKLSLALNKKFSLNLRSKLPLRIRDDKGSEISFSRFTDTSATDDAVYSLFSNRSGNHFLLKKLKNVDYIFQVHSPENNNNPSSFISLLRETDSVNAVFTIDISTFRDKNLQYLIL